MKNTTKYVCCVYRHIVTMSMGVNRETEPECTFTLKERDATRVSKICVYIYIYIYARVLSQKKT